MFEFDSERKFGFIYKEDPANIRLRTNHIRAHIDKTLESYSVPEKYRIPLYFDVEPTSPAKYTELVQNITAKYDTGGLILLQHDVSFIINFLKAASSSPIRDKLVMKEITNSRF